MGFLFGQDIHVYRIHSSENWFSCLGFVSVKLWVIQLRMMIWDF